MGEIMSRYSKDQLTLFNCIEQIFQDHWDPIGLACREELKSFYDGYLSHIYRLALNGADVSKIHTLLIDSVEQGTGLRADRSHYHMVAQLIVSSRDEVLLS